MNPVVGIDLGTTHSLVAIARPDGPVVLRDEAGRKLLPSVVTYAADGSTRVGEAALAAAEEDATRVAYSFKRFMGRGAEDLGAVTGMLPFDFSASSAASVRLRLGMHVVTPEELSSVVLGRLRAIAETQLATPVTQAVVTVPAYFNDAQRQATLAAAELAGLSVLRLVNEPTAACLAYGLDRKQEGVVAVYDLGGGTFDLSILRLVEGIFEVLATHGDTELGGDDIDRALMAVVADQVKAATGIDLLATPELRLRLRGMAKQAKEALSEAESVDAPVRLPDGRTLALALARQDLETLARPVLERTMAACQRALADAGLEAQAIDAVVLVGGATRMPLVKRMVAELFGKTPFDSLDPDEVVAQGAAIQAAILSGERSDMLLLDVVPLSLGIETMGGAVSRLIERNTTIPSSATELFTTFADNQTAVDLHVLQGERELARDCRSLARFQVRIPPQPAGMARVEVRFAVDANGVLTVTATDLRAGERREVVVRPTYGLSEVEVEAVVAASEAHAEEDAEARDRVAASNDARKILEATRKALGQPAAEALDEDERGEILSAMSMVQMAIESEDTLFMAECFAKLDLATRHLADVLAGADYAEA